MHTVLCAFTDPAAADRAVDRLVDAGFSREDIHKQHRDLHVDSAMSTEDWDGMEREVAVDRHVLEAIGNFFSNLFGQDHKQGHAGTYAELVKRGECVVVVDAEDELRAQRAAALLDGAGGRDRNIVPRSHKRLKDIVGGKIEV
ncbi:MAG: hypothetical protein HY854_11640 [Burkholderiales bacterium]|nr:hypothetical protein [Burkholderiales bacterium]